MNVITKWFNRQVFKYRYECPNEHISFIERWESGYCYICGAELVKVDNRDNLCPNCGCPISLFDKYCSKCGYRKEVKENG